MKTETRIKKEAKGIMKNSYAKTVFSVFVLLLFFFLFDSVATLLGLFQNEITNFFSDDNSFIAEVMYRSLWVITLLIPWIVFILLSPFINGLIRFFYIPSYTNNYDVNDLIYYFRKGYYERALKFNLSYFFRMIIPTIIFFIPVITYAILCSLLFKDFLNSPSFTIVLIILIILSLVLTYLYSIRYFVASRIFIEEENFEIKRYFEISKDIMNNKTMEMFRLLISFVPMILLCLLVLPIFYVIPYILQSFSISAKYLILLKKENIHYDESIPMYNSVQ